MDSMEKKLVQHHAHTNNTPDGDENGNDRKEAVVAQDQKVTFLACFQGGVASLGGFIFGYIRYDGW